MRTLAFLCTCLCACATASAPAPSAAPAPAAASAPAPAAASAPAAAPAAAAPTAPAQGAHYALAGEHKIGGDGFWDYLTTDAAARRLYVAHGTQIEVIDLDKLEKIGAIPGVDGAHGVAVVPELHKAFATSGRDGMVLRFDTVTLQAEGKLAVGKRPDAIAYEPKSGRVFAMLGGDKEAVAIDPHSFTVVGRIPLAAKPEFTVAMDGKLYVNLEDTSELAQLDPLAMKLVARWPLKPCEEPSGLAADAAHQRLIAVCGNQLAAFVDTSGKVLGTATIGEGTDGVAFDPARGFALASNGEGTMSVLGAGADGVPKLVETVQTRKGARTIAFDEKTGRALTVTAQMMPAEPAAAGEHKRPAIVRDTFALLVFGAP